MWFHYTAKQINHEIKKSSEYCHVVDWKQKVVCDPNDISDWYHTFWELYKHRIHLFIALCSVLWLWEHPYDNMKIIKSKLHDDWSWMEWWFIVQLVQIDRYTKEDIKWTQISYHFPNEYWDECWFINTLEKANPWDWHTSSDVLERLLNI